VCFQIRKSSAAGIVGNPSLSAVTNEIGKGIQEIFSLDEKF
jgi:hypothetical protein